MKLLFLLVTLLSAAAFAADTTALLEEADGIKSQKPHKFKQIIQKLSGDTSGYSTYQKNYLDYLQAYSTVYSGEPEKAIQGFIKVFEVAKSSDLKIRALTSSLNMYGITRNYVEGYNDAIRLIPLIPDASREVQANAYAGLSIFYNQIGEYDLGLWAAQKVLEISDVPRTLCFASYTKLESEFNLGAVISPSSADSVISQCKKIQENAATLMSLVIKAKLYRNLGDNDSARATLLTHEPIFDDAYYPVAKADYRAELSYLQLLGNDLETAEKHANEAIELSKGAGLYSSRIQAYEVLYKRYEEKGDYVKALHYYKAFSDTQKAFLDEVKVTRLAIQQSKFETLEKANQIDLLNKENTLLVTRAELAKQEIENSRLVILTLLLLASIILVWLLVNRKLNLQLKRQARTDELTGIANRHHFTQLAVSSLRYHEKTRQSLTLVLFDLDFFKRINDSYGHLIGDWALKAVVKAVQDVVRNQDVVGRLGGEEFGILLPGCAVKKARTITEKCRKAIAAIDTSPTGEQFTITASFGVADTQTCKYKFDALYASADQALYRSKGEGRNRVFVFDEIIELPSRLTEQPG